MLHRYSVKLILYGLGIYIAFLQRKVLQFFRRPLDLQITMLRHTDIPHDRIIHQRKKAVLQLIQQQSLKSIFRSHLRIRLFQPTGQIFYHLPIFLQPAFYSIDCKAGQTVYIILGAVLDN